MIGSLDLSVLQNIWWLIIAVVGSLFLFLTFVQGGQSLLWQLGKSDIEKKLIINSLGRKWELTFTTLVLFGGAFFAAFPKFYSTSFGGAYWVWMIILFTFILQAVSYEYRTKPNNVYGAGVYECFLLINGVVGVLLIGAAVGTFFTGSNFTLNMFNQVSWTHPLKGLEAAFSLFNLSFGLFLVFNSRVLGAMYLLNNIELTGLTELEARLRKQTLINLICALPFLLYILVSLLVMDGFGVDADGIVSMVEYKYLHNLIEMPWTLGLLLVGLIMVVWGVFITSFKTSKKGIWFAGLGTVFVGLAVFFIAGYNGTSFYPSKVDLQSSLTLANSSSTHYTLTVMAYVALAIPFVLGYIVYFWRKMDAQQLSMADIDDKKAY
ncbi:MAG: cytochrome d ubiquinol oxidase subunit II [Desulfotalea sp.]